MTLSETKKYIKKLESFLPKALAGDRYALQSEIRRFKRSRADSLSYEKIAKNLFSLEKKLNASIKKRIWRKENLPEPSYDNSLPITAKKNEIIDAILTNQVLIISGETGSGKTTQIPKFCLAAGRGINGKIGCTQPRRIAATTVAFRIAEELGEELGRSIGYKIRFADKTKEKSFIKIMTDGILLAETSRDPYLNEYDTLIVDEAHERNLNIDFVLGILKTLLKKRKDLKLIITSATIDTEKFSKAFNNARVIEVSGRMYPVELQYFPAEPETCESSEQTHIDMAVSAVDGLDKKSPYGDILVFMPTEQDIRETCELLEGRNYKEVTILPLYARLSAHEQSRVFSSMSGRKIIIATNIAETSITIPGIKYVIDTGLARIPRYTPRSRTTSLPVLPVSQSSADQRKGRCGRVENGICIRLFSEQDFLSRPLFTPPEILRANLAEVILRMIYLNLGDISDFPFIDRPAPGSIRDGFDLLYELGAIVTDHKSVNSKQKKTLSLPFLSKKGRLMAKIPVDPRLSRMLIEAQKEGCIKEIAIIASALSLPDPRERPGEKTGDADMAHAAFTDPSSDFITLLNIWKRYHDVWQKEKTTGSMKRFCKENFLSFKRMREWRDIHAQISDILKEYGIKDSGRQNAAKSEILYTAIHLSILSGFLSNIAMKKEKNIYKAAKGKEVMIFPGSGLFNRGKLWIVSGELVETTRIFARTAANIESNWLEDLGKDHCKYTYLHPHWERNRGEVIAFEQVSLYGLVIISQRPVPYGRINPDDASDIFIRCALVEGDLKRPFPFMKHNKRLMDEIEDAENRVRRRDILVSEHEIVQFYKERVNGIYDARSLRKLIKENGDDTFLRMKKEGLLCYLPDEKEFSLFPDRVVLWKKSFECSYRFNPGKDDDGVTVKIPSGSASEVPHESTDWLVPGLLREKITTLIKSLPKTYRTKLVPVAGSVDIILKEMPKKETSLLTALSQFIYARFGVDIPRSAWPYDLLPDHLMMRISLTGPKGEELSSGRDMAILGPTVLKAAGLNESDEFKTVRKAWEKTHITRWNFGDLPETITIKGMGGAEWTLYPCLVKSKQGAGKMQHMDLCLFCSRDEAEKSHKEGIAALFSIFFSKDLTFLKRMLVLPGKIKAWADYFGGARRVEQNLYDSVINDLFFTNIRTKNAFDSHAKTVAPEIFSMGQRKLESFTDVLIAYHESRTTLYGLEKSNQGNREVTRFLRILRQELSRLVPDTFMLLYDSNRLAHVIKYIKGITIRAKKGVVNLEKDRVREKELIIYTEKLNHLLQEISPYTSEEEKCALEEFFWLIEEYKVSLFAQELKTHIPVSKKRLDKKLKEIERMILFSSR